MLVDELEREHAAPKHLHVCLVDDWEGGEDRKGSISERDTRAAEGEVVGGSNGSEAALDLCLPALRHG